MSRQSKQIVVCDECGCEVDRDSWSDGHVDVCSACLTKPHEHAHGPYVAKDRCARCQKRMVEPDELVRREAWQINLEHLADAADPRPERWQVELAARILARPYHWSVTGKGDIWVMGQTTAAELGDDMVADGRLQKWGNWPDRTCTAPDDRRGNGGGMSEQDPFGILRRGPVRVPPNSPPPERPPPPEPGSHPVYAALLAAANANSVMLQLLELHKPKAEVYWKADGMAPVVLWHCEGEPPSGYEWDYADWPCETTAVIARHFGVESEVA